MHRALRRGATAIARGAATLEDAGVERRKAFARYWAGYDGEVLAHHSIEDDMFFPDLIMRVPAAAALVDRTGAEHLELDEILHEIRTAVAEVREGRPAPRLAASTVALEAHMTEHLDFEDRELLPLFERHYTAEEYAELDQKALKSLGIGRQAAFTVPFIVAAMPADEARHTIATAPVPLRILHRLTRASHARLVERAFGAQQGEVV